MKKSLKNNNKRPTSGQGGAATSILDVAERLAQTRGYNGFSYADIAAELDVTKASLHYHFPSKEALGRALVERYRAAFAGALDAIDRSAGEPAAMLRGYVDLYSSVMANDRMCLCGMLAAEFSTLPASMQAELIRFFDMNERWLAGVLESGRRAGAFSYKESAGDRARVIIAALEGAMLVARSYRDAGRFTAAAAHVLEELTAAG